MATKSICSVSSAEVVFNHIVASDFEEQDYVTHCHDRCEIIFFIKGKATYAAEGKRYNLGFGDVVLSPPSAMHAVLPSNSEKYERINVIINEKLLPKTLWERIKNAGDVFRCRDNERIVELFSKLDFYYGKFSDREYSRLVFNIVEEILYNLSFEKSAEEEMSQNLLLEKALLYIKDNLTEIKGIEEVSAALYITKSHLHHLFSKFLRITPAKYIVSKRLILARKRIRRGERPTAIYSECGFEDYATFFRNYKKYFGYSPTGERDAEIKSNILS